MDPYIRFLLSCFHMDCSWITFILHLWAKQKELRNMWSLIAVLVNIVGYNTVTLPFGNNVHAFDS